MKRSLIVILALALVAGALAAPATAKKKKKKKKAKRIERTVEARYEFPSGVGSSGIGACSGCPAFPNMTGEGFIHVEVIDDATPLAAISLSWDTDGDGVADTGIEVCGETDGFLPIPEGVSPTAFPNTVGGPGCPASATSSGSIKVTYSNMP